jgi:hypothetical protein
VHRWPAEATLLLGADGLTDGAVEVRLGGRRGLVLDRVPAGDDAGPPAMTITTARPRDGHSKLPVLPDAATWTLPDLELLRAGLIDAALLHPLVASTLVPGHRPDRGSPIRSRPGHPRSVECRGALHRIGLVDGALAPLDHDPVEIRREELLAALTGTPVPCLQAIGEAHRHPECLSDIRERLDHGDLAGALAAVEGLLGPDAVIPRGALQDELETAALRQIDHGLYRAGLAGLGPATVRPRRADPRRDLRDHPRHATTR